MKIEIGEIFVPQRPPFPAVFGVQVISCGQSKSSNSTLYESRESRNSEMLEAVNRGYFARPFDIPSEDDAAASQNDEVEDLLAIKEAARAANLLDENGKFRKILGTLPITADGMVVGMGATIYNPSMNCRDSFTIEIGQTMWVEAELGKSPYMGARFSINPSPKWFGAAPPVAL